MMQIINALNANKFPSSSRDDYTLLNAHPLPRYIGRLGYDGKSQPTKADVLDAANIIRLAQQIDGTDITRLLLTGKTPKLLIQTLCNKYPDMEFFSCGHPSPSAWDRHYAGHPKAEKYAYGPMKRFIRNCQLRPTGSVSNCNGLCSS
jgi:hypothetical protein